MTSSPGCAMGDGSAPARLERVAEDVSGDAPALGDALGLVERPVDAEVDAALAVLLLRLRERCEAARLRAAAPGRRCPRVTPLNSSETNVNGDVVGAVEAAAASGTARRRSRRAPTDSAGTAA